MRRSRNPPLRAILLDVPEFDAYGQMALDETLLDRAEPETVVLRFYRWPGGVLDRGPEPAPKAVTFGYFQPYEAALRHIHGRGLSVTFPVVRRPTGGGIVYHDGDITFSLIFPWAKLVSASWIYKDMHRAVHLGLKARALPSRLWSPPKEESGDASTDAAAVACFAGPSPMDLVHENGVKCLGGALRRRRGVGLYQGSLRQEGFGAATREQLIGAVTEGLGLQWKTVFVPQSVPPELLKEACRLREERYAAEDWNKRR